MADILAGNSSRPISSARQVHPVSVRTQRFGLAARIGHILAVASAIVLLVGAGALFVFRAMYGDHVLPSITVADVPVGGMTRADAQAAVDARANTLLNGPIVFDYNGQTWTTSLSQLGVTANTTASVDGAFEVGRESGAKARLRSAYTLARSDTVVPLQMMINPSAIDTWAQQVTADIGKQPSDATIAIANGKVSVIDEVDGVVVDMDALNQIIGTSISTMQPYRGTLPTVDKLAEIRASDLDGQVNKLNAMLAKPVKLVYKSKNWTLSPSYLGQFIVLQESRKKPGYDLSVDDSARG